MMFARSMGLIVRQVAGARNKIRFAWLLIARCSLQALAVRKRLAILR